MSMLEWAREEIELACIKERGDKDPNEWDYGVACYESALKAYESLLGDEHSGMSIIMTKHILNRLVDGKPLTPIEDVEESWNHYHTDNNGVMHYQNKRMSALFKEVYPDGTVKYSDVNRAIGINIDDPSYNFHSGLIRDIVDDFYPITMPYWPTSSPYEVYVEDFLYDVEANGDYDTSAILYMIRPDGEKKEIRRFFKEVDNKFIEIDEKEYLERKQQSKGE